MNLELQLTQDGSDTFYNPAFDDTYHSVRGAIQEARHIFIREGLLRLKQQKTINILEVGFGTGLNALCTLEESVKANLRINYIGIENFPLSLQQANLLNYKDFFSAELYEMYLQMHELPRNTPHFIGDNFVFNLLESDFRDIEMQNSAFDLVYFDPFKPATNGELWTQDIFEKVFHALRVNGLLLTYSSNSAVRKAMTEAGFCVEKIAGPPGKREISLATKVISIADCQKNCHGCSHEH